MTEKNHTTDKQVTKKLAAMLTPSDANYVFVCVDCRTAWTKQRDCPTTRGVRDGKTTCGECGNELTMAVDKKQ